MFDNSSYKILKCLYKKEREELDVLRALVQYDGPMTFSPQLSSLIEDKMVAPCYEGTIPDGEGGYKDGKTFFRITVTGRAYVEQKRKTSLLFWLPYGITTLIAAASLLVSIAGLVR